MKHLGATLRLLVAGLAGAALLACPGKDGTSCSVTQNADGSATITCTDGTSVVVQDGVDGTDGTDGNSCSVDDNGDGTKTITCTDGTSVVVTDGSNGTSCTVTQNTDGSKTIACADGTSVTVRDGEPGPQGMDVAIGSHHGEAFMQSTGEFATAGKYYAGATVTSATADADGLLTVNFTATDKAGAPLKTLASCSVGVAKLVPAPAGEASSRWVSYLWSKQTVTTAGPWPGELNSFAWQATRESAGTGPKNGTLTNHGDGSYTYVMKQNLALATRDGTTLVGYDRALTHRVTVTFGGHSGPTATADFDFVPDGTSALQTRELIATSTCQNCHGSEFHGHGGDRLTLKNCVTCHNPGPGNYDPHGLESMDMKVMAHKIHAGGELASIPGADGYVWDNPATVGDESADNGEYAWWGHNTSYASWWKVGFPAVIENCTVCHQGTTPDVDNWKTKPGRDACGSCHDNISFVDPPPAGKVLHSGGAFASDTDPASCAGCHPAEGPGVGKSVALAHDWTNPASPSSDHRNIPEFETTLSMSAPANGQFYEGNEAPVITVVLKKDDVVINHLGIAEDDAAEGCTSAPCPSDAMFAASSLFVSGPRAARNPVLTTTARAQIYSTSTGPFDLTGATAFGLKIDQGASVVTYDSSGGDIQRSGVISVPITASTFANIAAVTSAEIVSWLNANAAFKARAIASEVGGKVNIRSRNLGPVFALQLTGGPVTTAVFGGDTNVKMPGGYYPSNVLAARIDVTKQDPKVRYFIDRIEYQLDPVTDLKPGTYVVYTEIADAGRISETNYRTPSVAKLTFQVKTATEEKPVADNCSSCHQGPDGRGFVLDWSRHQKKFDYNAVDGCGSCHDYQPQIATGTAFAGGKPISKRVHAVHFGSSLNYPLTTVDYSNGDPIKGRNWDITYPQDVRNCETCHDANTSGTWLTKPGRLACGGCHDADAAVAHMRLSTFDPTPADAFSGDEQESCATCH